MATPFSLSPDDPDDEPRAHHLAGTGRAAEITLSIRDAAIVAASARGQQVAEIAKAHGLAPRQVARIIREAAQAVRANMAEVGERAILLQLERLERLYVLIEREMQAYERELEKWMDAEDPGERPKLDVNAVRAAVALFDRQAKLLGIDKVTDKGPSGQRWGGLLKDMPIDRVLAYAEQLDMKAPSEFET